MFETKIEMSIIKSLPFHCFVLSTTVLCCILYNWHDKDDLGFVEGVCYGFLAVVLCGLSLVSLDVCRKRCSKFHTNSTLLNHYIIYKALAWVGWFMMRKLNSETKDVRKTQEIVLLDRIQSNLNTAYGKDFHFAEVKSREDYVRVHPLTRYSHYEQYVQRQMQGETSVLTKDSPVLFGVTSGTSGKSSILPMTQRQQGLFFLKGISVVCSAMLSAFPETYQLLKVLKFFYTPKWRKSSCGTLIGPGSSSPSNSGRLMTIYSTPLVAFQELEEEKTLYLHLLFALRDPNIGMLESNFISSIYSGFKALEIHWQQLISDIERGQVNPNLGISEQLRKELNLLLTPDPKRAAELHEALQDGNVGLAKRIWPHCNVILSCDTGTFSLYGRLLQDSYCKGIPVFSCLYAATEGLLGINIWPKVRPAQYLLHPAMMFFEFIPVENSSEAQPSTLFMEQVKCGSVYELVITTLSGLYRYRFGDVVKVVDFYNTCPVIEFMYRQGQLLNVHAEKTSEATFYQALTTVVREWPNITLLDYCCAESVLIPSESHCGSSPYYVVFLELEGTEQEIHACKPLFSQIDMKLCELSYVYNSFRVKGSIGDMVIHAVSPGTFATFRQISIISNSGTSNQYKIPRVLKRTQAVQFFMSKILF